MLTAKPKKENNQGLSYPELLEKRPNILKETNSFLAQYKVLTLKYAQLLSNTEQKLRDEREHIDRCQKIIQEKETQIQQNAQKLTEIYESLSWRTIRTVLKPYHILKSFLTIQKK